MRIVYDDLVRDYLDSLNAKLRNFSVEPAFLATWVHDEDDHASLYELFAAARSAGRRELAVAVGPASAKRLDEARLRALLAPLGAVSVARAAGGAWEVSVALGEGAPPPRADVRAPAAKPAEAAKARVAAPASAAPAREPGELHPAYRAALERLSARPRFEGPAPAAPAGGLVVEADEGGARLAVAAGADGVVAAAAHSGAAGALRGALDGLCGLLPGRPLREGRDHALIRLEALLRDRSVAAPAAGLVTPRNADPVFAVPEKLIRAAYRDWAAKTGAEPGWNFWDDSPSDAWLKLTAEERLSRAKAAVLEACRELGVPEAGVEVLDVLNGCRLVLAAAPETVKPGFAPRLMRLEERVKSKLDPRLELQLESLEDRNRRA
ncbi:MAG TPA: hypothetical protein VH309_10160, partial [Elusimicrobiota bacterium]|nr:hypothetical protein [Elusimicrobiota bacterium]